MKQFVVHWSSYGYFPNTFDVNVFGVWGGGGGRKPKC